MTPAPAPPSAPRGLHEAAVGASLLVASVTGDDALARRLADLGFWPGAQVEVVRRAPFGDPTAYQLHGYRIALRRDEAARVQVHPR